MYIQYALYCSFNVRVQYMFKLSEHAHVNSKSKMSKIFRLVEVKTH